MSRTRKELTITEVEEILAEHLGIAGHAEFDWRCQHGSDGVGVYEVEVEWKEGDSA